MKQNKSFLILALSALTLFIVICSTNVFAADGVTVTETENPMALDENDNVISADEVTVTGTVNPMALDENDNVIAVVITNSVDEEYIIVDNIVGKELFNLEYKVVEASGVVGEDSNGNKTLTVNSYKVISDGIE